MKKVIYAAVLSASVLTLAACGSSDSEVLVKTSAGEVTKDQLYDAMKERYGEGVLKELVTTKVLSKQYKVSDKEVQAEVDKLKAQYGDQFPMALQQSGFKDEAQFKEYLRSSLLAEKAATKDIKIEEKDMKAQYEKMKYKLKASHILVADEKTAKEVEEKLKKGEKFEDLAKEYSTDSGTKDKGGDLGEFGAGQMVAAFEDAAYKLNPGQISEPVKSDYGYHIIKLVEKKEQKVEPYEDIKDQIKQDLAKKQIDQEKITEAINNAIKDAKVKVEDKDFKNTFKTE
ncbi:MAG: peptidylprolyl isomerase [Bacillaceae bacterium]